MAKLKITIKGAKEKGFTKATAKLVRKKKKKIKIRRKGNLRGRFV